MSDYTPNYNLDLYTEDDRPNLCDQYNAAMGKVDSQLKVAEGNVNIAITNANNAVSSIDGVQSNLDTLTQNTATEVKTLTESIESLTDAYQADLNQVRNEMTDIQHDTNTNTTSIASLQTAVNNKFPVTTANIADNSITAAKLNKSAYNAILEGFVIHYFDSTNSAADNTGMQTGNGCTWCGFFVEGLNLLVVQYMEMTAQSGGIPNIFNDPTNFVLPTYVPRPTSRIKVASCNAMFVDGSNRSFQGIQINPSGAIGFNTGATSATAAVYTTGPVIAWMGAYGTTYSASGNAYTDAVANNGAL